MTDVTIADPAQLTAPAADDKIPVWDTSAAQQKWIRRDDLVGATLTGGFSVVVPAAGTMSLIDVPQSYGAQQLFPQGLSAVRGQVIADDAVYSMAVVSAGWLLIGTTSAGFSNRHAIIAFRAGTGPYTGVVVQPSTVFEVSTSVLAGTTGTDGKITISATGGMLYIENRSGASQSFTFAIIN